MNRDLLDLFHAADGGPRAAARIFGAVIGVVTNNNDDSGMGRVKVKFPWLSESNESFWARIGAPMAGNQRGAYFLPEIDDEVLVVFEHGDVRSPFVIGALWNGKDKPPVDNKEGGNHVRMIKSRSGHVIRLNDKAGKETIEIIDGSGGSSIIIDTAKGTVTISAKQDIVLSAPDGTIRLDAQTIQANASGEAKLAGKKTDIGGTEGLKLHAARVDIN